MVIARETSYHDLCQAMLWNDGREGFASFLDTGSGQVAFIMVFIFSSILHYGILLAKLVCLLFISHYLSMHCCIYVLSSRECFGL